MMRNYKALQQCWLYPGAIIGLTDDQVQARYPHSIMRNQDHWEPKRDIAFKPGEIVSMEEEQVTKGMKDFWELVQDGQGQKPGKRKPSPF